MTVIRSTGGASVSKLNKADCLKQSVLSIQKHAIYSFNFISLDKFITRFITVVYRFYHSCFARTHLVLTHSVCTTPTSSENLYTTVTHLVISLSLYIDRSWSREVLLWWSGTAESLSGNHVKLVTAFFGYCAVSWHRYSDILRFWMVNVELAYTLNMMLWTTHSLCRITVSAWLVVPTQ